MIKIPETYLDSQARNFLRKALTVAVQINEHDLNMLVDLFEFVSYKKNSIVINEGEISNNFYFIYKGLVKVYYYKNDKIVIDRFEQENSFFGGNFTHITKLPGTYIYESIEDVVLMRINCDDLENLCNKSHDIERLYRINLEFFHKQFVDRIASFKSTSSVERYQDFILQYGALANRVSLKDIANYLNMTPETISRIRSRTDR